VTPRADYQCPTCNHVVELPTTTPTIPGYQNAGKGWTCRHCNTPLHRVWTPIAIGKGTSGKTPPRG
jgi:rubrerythrin